jgi:hypothetical protein
MSGVRVRGQLVWPKDVQFDPRTQVVLDRSGGGFYTESAHARVREDGSFEFLAVAPGSYLLAAYTHSSGRMEILGRQRVEVTDAGIEDLLVASNPSNKLPLEGRVRIEGESNVNPTSLQVTVMLDPPEEERDFQAFGSGFRGSALVKADGRFTIENLDNGRFRVSVSADGSARRKFADYYLKAATVGGKGVLEDGLWIRGGQIGGLLELVLSPAGARIEGVVLDDGEKPAPGAYVMAVPANHRQEPFEMQTTDQYGQFVLRGLRPGRYTLLAWQGEGGYFSYRDPEFLTKYEDRGTKATLKESDRQNVQLRAFRLEER